MFFYVLIYLFIYFAAATNKCTSIGENIEATYEYKDKHRVNTSHLQTWVNFNISSGGLGCIRPPNIGSVKCPDASQKVIKNCLIDCAIGNHHEHQSSPLLGLWIKAMP